MVHFIPQATPDMKGDLGEWPHGVRGVGGVGPTEDTFIDMVKSKVQEVNAQQNKADRFMQEGALKGASNIHETMVEMEKADLSLRLMLRVREKAISAYQEIMRMQF